MASNAAFASTTTPRDSGIIEGYEQLISDTPSGSRTRWSSTTPATAAAQRSPVGRTCSGAAQRSHLRYLVPFDMEASTEADFRGLLAEELSALQRRLTAKTANVTTILDCCHSGTMSQGSDRAAEDGGPRVLHRGGTAAARSDRRFCRDRATPWTTPTRSLSGSVACDPAAVGVRASELAGWQPRRAHRAARPACSGSLGDRPLDVARRSPTDLRRNITTTLPMQRPEVEGPADRLLFSLTTRSAAGALPATVRDGVARIDAARLFGVVCR